ncbi:FecR family protein [Sphingobium boeckii]|uniref:Transmembrane sensor n=1 Tax=Sphingobium boeckii TaxID=1082345 RepID=A0A7W9AFS7_9SPHN|nr:FecR domain-containing protein [Sphingobium boeckii]MBB5684862.1 transmembrane sensor [Sphingobium boeckii]
MQIAADAALWVNRLDQPVIDTSASAAFDAWMAADARHRESFADMQALWHSDTLLQALERSEASIAEGEAPVTRASRFADLRRSALWFAMAGSAAMLFLIVPKLGVETYRTGTGGGRTIVLADGSHVDLSGDAELSVRIMPWRREVTLARGEAFFDVAHERWRPFLVKSGSTSVRVLGTAFNVDRQSATRTAVEVYRGAVTLDTPRTQDIVLHKGDHARVVDDRITAQATNPNAGVGRHDKPDWTAGWFEASDVPMSVLIAKVQRYSLRPIRLRDPKMAALPVSGRFQVSDPARVLNAIRGAYALEVRYDRDVIRIAPSAGGPAS